MFATTVAAADLTGSWTLEFRTGDSANVYTGECAFAQEGERLQGSCGSGQTTPVPVTGSIKGNTATFQFRTGLDAGYTATFSGQLDASETSMKGKWQFVDQQGNKGDGTFTASKH
jgi:hypothetical protein